MCEISWYMSDVSLVEFSKKIFCYLKDFLCHTCMSISLILNYIHAVVNPFKSKHVCVICIPSLMFEIFYVVICIPSLFLLSVCVFTHMFTQKQRSCQVPRASFCLTGVVTVPSRWLVNCHVNQNAQFAIGINGSFRSTFTPRSEHFR